MVRRTMRAVARRAKLPAEVRFRHMIGMGLIDEQGRLNHRSAPKTTVGELIPMLQRRSREAMAAAWKSYETAKK